MSCIGDGDFITQVVYSSVKKIIALLSHRICWLGDQHLGSGEAVTVVYFPLFKILNNSKNKHFQCIKSFPGRKVIVYMHEQMLILF